MLMYFFFFKQKTAYEMLRSLVGSEMCIRDSDEQAQESCLPTGEQRRGDNLPVVPWQWHVQQP